MSPWLRNLGSAGLKKRKQVLFFPEDFFATFKFINKL